MDKKIIDRFKNKDIYTLPLWGMKEKENKNFTQVNSVVFLTVEDFGSWLKEK